MPSSPPRPSPERLLVAPRARPRPSVARLAIAPATLVLCAALFYALRWPMPGVVAVALVALLASIWIGPLLDRARATFDRDFVELVARGTPERAARRLREARLFRWLGAPADVAEREGRLARALGDRAAALAAYRRALSGYDGQRAPLSVVAGLGHAAYEAGELDLAAAALGAALVAAPDLPEVRPRLAHVAFALAGPSPDEREAELPLREGEGETARLVLALRALRAGDLAPARAALAAIPDDAGASWGRARADVRAALDAAAPSKRRSARRRKGEAGLRRSPGRPR